MRHLCIATCLVLISVAQSHAATLLGETRSSFTNEALGTTRTLTSSVYKTHGGSFLYSYSFSANETRGGIDDQTWLLIGAPDRRSFTQVYLDAPLHWSAEETGGSNRWTYTAADDPNAGSYGQAAKRFERPKEIAVYRPEIDSLTQKRLQWAREGLSLSNLLLSDARRDVEGYTQWVTRYHELIETSEARFTPEALSERLQDLQQNVVQSTENRDTAQTARNRAQAALDAAHLAVPQDLAEIASLENALEAAELEVLQQNAGLIYWTQAVGEIEEILADPETARLAELARLQAWLEYEQYLLAEAEADVIAYTLEVAESERFLAEREDLMEAAQDAMSHTPGNPTATLLLYSRKGAVLAPILGSDARTGETFIFSGYMPDANLRVAPVPLPASLPVLAAALGLVGWIGRRRQARA